METLQEFKCPCCGGAIAFDSATQKLKCPYCDTEFDTEALADYDAGLTDAAADDMQWDTAAGGAWQDGEEDSLRSYVCKSCGGEIVGIGSIVDRTGGKIDFGVPYKSAFSMDITSYEPDECPICKTGKPLVKPGSRGVK